MRTWVIKNKEDPKKSSISPCRSSQYPRLRQSSQGRNEPESDHPYPGFIGEEWPWTPGWQRRRQGVSLVEPAGNSCSGGAGRKGGSCLQGCVVPQNLLQYWEASAAWVGWQGRLLRAAGCCNLQKLGMEKPFSQESLILEQPQAPSRTCRIEEAGTGRGKPPRCRAP